MDRIRRSIHNILDIMTTHRASGCIVVLFMSLFVLFLYLEIETYQPHPSILFRICGALADASILTLPLVFLRGKWRYLGAAVPVTVGALVLVNVLYYRNFNDLVPASLYVNNQAGDSLVKESAIESLRWSEVLLLVFGLLPLLWLHGDRKRHMDRCDRRFTFIALVCLAVFGWGVTLFGTLRREIIARPDEKVSISHAFFPVVATDWIRVYNNMNFTGYMVNVIRRSKIKYKELMSGDIVDIQGYLSSKAAGPVYTTDSCSKRNLIFIVVESLASVVLQREDAGVIAPVLTELTKDTTTVYVRRCKVLAGLGRSSDAQFMYNTGLLPLRDDVLVTNYAVNDYPSLAKALRLESVEVIGEDRRMWSHGQTNRSYGFTRLVDNASSGDDRLNQDSAIFAAAEAEIKQMSRPFYIFVSTLSMHDPYTTPTVTRRLDSPSVESNDPRDREYLERVRHFDESLGNFIQFLKDEGIYESTAVVITGDHEIRGTTVSSSLHDDAVPLIILNGKVRGVHVDEATQLDVFPTVMDVMGGKYEYMGVEYTGLGTSVFRRSAGSGVRMPDVRDYEISEMLIRRRCVSTR